MAATAPVANIVLRMADVCLEQGHVVVLARFEMGIMIPFKRSIYKNEH